MAAVDPGDSPSLAGRLLIATPALGDPNFNRTVVLILQHSGEGALGLVLNRPSQIDLGGPLRDWESMAAPPPVVFVGGPVSQGSVIALARVEAEPRPSDVWSPVLPRVGVLDLTSDPAAGGVAVEEVRLFTGYAGWAPHQLEGEIAEGAWFVVDADPADPLAPEPERLWPSVLRRQGGKLARLALYPPDPSVN